MSLRIRTFLTGLFVLITAFLLALAPVGAKPASGGYQLFEPTALADQHAIQLAALENFDYHAKIAPECCNAPKGGTGSLSGGEFAQVKAKPTKAFSDEGQRKWSELAGEPIATVQDLTNAIKSGKVNPSDIPVDYVVVNGKPVIANTRTSTALTDAGIPQSQWNGVNRTGQQQYPGQTFDQAVQNQLDRNAGKPISPSDW